MKILTWDFCYLLDTQIIETDAIGEDVDAQGDHEDDSNQQTSETQQDENYDLGGNNGESLTEVQKQVNLVLQSFKKLPDMTRLMNPYCLFARIQRNECIIPS